MLFRRRSLWLFVLFPLSCGPTSDWPSNGEGRGDDDEPPRGADAGASGSVMDASVTDGSSTPNPACGADAGDAGDAGCVQRDR